MSNGVMALHGRLSCSQEGCRTSMIFLWDENGEGCLLFPFNDSVESRGV